ncbi:serine/threonine protein kinase [Rhodococcus sp. BP-349]|uniref:serine/threonine-protein kinase n=1 Tax=unclassified Rhodococcus (in: high G+C Gram-positive bacteria) TaxID=192944 RepID=UPI001C9AD7EA|nr:MULTISPECIES: serine/threonine-protein kinase [unclassified Rhodococcus (in: high G+C Gram-positive bacteria)]MBY6538431.1 serine/threonine protein kinase [Rhodococcus sp. BP-363]MBY6542768.1 serine/threonine protein kinase [Rhodococcus sp. BP-369]MBY6561998.1 serine/threonine protein kinase [Rhodococcus sp. BP-370]MBY6576290.1 serine/threonine protein kinase [Rhodococcus sp. BP-364]MBY6585591.1 serine/threonine protein kinase [Rhodococcus sp. BP-358]
MAEQVTSPQSGTPRLVAGRYALGPVLGRGGVSDVFRATDRTLGRAVAVKLFRSDDHTPHDRRRIESEMRTLASLTHPGLVTLHDAGAESDVVGYDGPYLVMEFVDGATLSTFRAGGALPPEVVRQIGHQVAQALAHIHAVGIVHRDVKPANILITHDEAELRAKLTDFGIARIVDSDPLTEHGTAVGTAHYLSPEQATGEPTGPASDVYSLGLVLTECLTGRMVFEGSAIAAAIARLHRDPVIPDGLGPAWVALLTDMTSRAPADRPTAADVARRLHILTEDTDTAVLATPVATPSAAVSGRRSPVPWVLAALAICAVLVTALAVRGAGSDGEPTTEPPPSSTSAVVATTPAPTATPVPVPETVPEVAPPVAETTTVAPAPVVPQPAPSENGNSGNGNSGNGNSGNGNSGNGNSGNGNSGNGNNGNGNR